MRRRSIEAEKAMEDFERPLLVKQHIDEAFRQRLLQMQPKPPKPGEVCPTCGRRKNRAKK